jgi:hypothetical protein
VQMTLGVAQLLRLYDNQHSGRSNEGDSPMKSIEDRDVQLWVCEYRPADDAGSVVVNT